jgi:hypothetical protein
MEEAEGGGEKCPAALSQGRTAQRKFRPVSPVPFVHDVAPTVLSVVVRLVVRRVKLELYTPGAAV